MLIFNPSYVWQDMDIYWPASFVKFPWHCWKKFSRSWKDLRKLLQSHENLKSLTDLSGANIGIHSNSGDRLFWIFMMSKINPLMNKSAVLERCVNSILYFYKKQQKCDSKVWTYHCSISIEYIYLYQNCTDICVLISSNLMRNIRNEADKTFARTK